MSKLQTLAYKRYKKFQDAIQTRPARMGRNDGIISAGTTGYMIWITYFDGTQEKVLNQRIPNEYGKLVLVGFDPIHFPTRKQVLALWDVYPEAQWAGGGEHQDTHQWGGADPLWVHGEQFLPALVVPVAGSLKVQIYPVALLGATSWKLFYSITEIDVTSHLPANGYRYSLLVMDSTGAFTLRDGSIVVARNLLVDAVIPIPSSGDNVLAALVLYAGQTEISKRTGYSDILDLRFSNPLVTTAAIDGDALPNMSPTKKGGVPPTGTPTGKYLTDNATFVAIPAVVAAGASGLMTGSDKTKLDGILQSDWNATTGWGVVLNKPQISASYYMVDENLSSQVDGIVSTFALSGIASSKPFIQIDGIKQIPGDVHLVSGGLSFTLDWIPVIPLSLTAEYSISMNDMATSISGDIIISDDGTPIWI
jgi:hypothetical protein